MYALYGAILNLTVGPLSWHCLCRLESFSRILDGCFPKLLDMPGLDPGAFYVKSPCSVTWESNRSMCSNKKILKKWRVKGRLFARDFGKGTEDSLPRNTSLTHSPGTLLDAPCILHMAPPFFVEGNLHLLDWKSLKKFTMWFLGLYDLLLAIW